jgi:hypothetical protein
MIVVHRLDLPRATSRRLAVTSMKKDAEVMAMLENTSMEQMQDYLQRGRDLAHLSDVKVVDAWLAQMNLLAEQSKEYYDRMYNDCAAELSLRKIELPFDRADDAFKKIIANSKAYSNELLKDPARTAFLENKIAEKLEALRRAAKQLKN